MLTTKKCIFIAWYNLQTRWLVERTAGTVALVWTLLPAHRAQLVSPANASRKHSDSSKWAMHQPILGKGGTRFRAVETQRSASSGIYATIINFQRPQTTVGRRTQARPLRHARGSRAKRRRRRNKPRHSISFFKLPSLTVLFKFSKYLDGPLYNIWGPFSAATTRILASKALWLSFFRRLYDYACIIP